ncbi:hypothetical protein [Solihabitans fulvus]|uniref:hypothetical protein n=1 Tax=Solihabitans fulvus TaxID=1892852 RepID=UPI001661C647|nr:hypothetical protein [Solihabitans fulvus]
MSRRRHGRHREPRPPRPRLTRTTVALSVLVLGVVAALFPTASATPPATSLDQTPVDAADMASADQPGADQASVDPNAPSPNCTLLVPADPLSATGLAKPYQLTRTGGRGGQCHEATVTQSAFVEATILDLATGALSVYRPLVVDRGTQPAADPVAPTLPANAVVGLWFGFNGTTLALRAQNGGRLPESCVNGARNSLFGQFAYCNAAAFFTAANAAIAKGQLAIPALGKAKDGQPCPTTRDFGLVDQDQSDNVNTSYLVLADGRTAQNTAANTKALHRSKPLVNGSDNLLVDAFVDRALGCTPFTAPDLTNHGQRVSSLALNELLAAAGQAKPVALVPTNDPMAQVHARSNPVKTNLYRTGVGQPPLDSATETPKAYCEHLVAVAPARIALDRNLTRRAPSPDRAAATNLFTFLAQRLSGSLGVLDCLNLVHVPNPVHLVTNAAGTVTDATFDDPTAPVDAGVDADAMAAPDADTLAATQADSTPGSW